MDKRDGQGIQAVVHAGVAERREYGGPQCDEWQVIGGGSGSGAWRAASWSDRS